MANKSIGYNDNTYHDSNNVIYRGATGSEHITQNDFNNDIVDHLNGVYKTVDPGNPLQYIVKKLSTYLFIRSHPSWNNSIYLLNVYGTSQYGVKATYIGGQADECRFSLDINTNVLTVTATQGGLRGILMRVGATG